MFAFVVVAVFFAQQQILRQALQVGATKINFVYDNLFQICLLLKSDCFVQTLCWGVKNVTRSISLMSFWGLWGSDKMRFVRFFRLKFLCWQCKRNCWSFGSCRCHLWFFPSIYGTFFVYFWWIMHFISVRIKQRYCWLKNLLLTRMRIMWSAFGM